MWCVCFDFRSTDISKLNRNEIIIQVLLLRLFHECSCKLTSGAQPRVKSWGGPRFGSLPTPGRLRPAKSRAGCWLLGAGGARCEGPGVSSPENYWKLRCQILHWWLLAVKFLAFWKLRPKSWGTNTLLVPSLKVGGPVSPGPYGCCAYDSNLIITD